MGIIRKFPLLLVALLAALPAALLPDSGAVHAQDGLPPIGDYRDLSLSVEIRPSIFDFVATVSNHSTIPMRNVQVQFTTDPPLALEAVSSQSVEGSQPVEQFDPSTNIWTLPEARPDILHYRMIVTPKSFHSDEYVTFRAEIIASDPAESVGNLDNNQGELWMRVPNPVTAKKKLVPDVELRTIVNNRLPDPGENPVFTVLAVDTGFTTTSRIDYDMGNVVAKVALSEGLAFASTPNPPSGTSFSQTSPTTGVWRLGRGSWKPGGTLRVPARLTTEAGAAPPLNRRCLTAQIVDGIPPPLSASYKVAATKTVCLGKESVAVLSDPGHRVGISAPNCAAFSRSIGLCRGDETDETAPLSVARINPITRRVSEYHRLENTVFLVDATPIDPTHTFGGKTYHWATGHFISTLSEDNRFPGVLLYLEVRSNNIASSRRFTISNVAGHNNPGEIAFFYRWVSGGTVNFFTALDPDDNNKLVDNIQDSRTTTEWDRLVAFSAPGVYKVNLGIEYTRKSDNVMFSPTGIVTFVVGLTGDLRVHGAVRHGTLPQGQQAYILRAENNLDGTAGLVEVALTGVPRGAIPEVSSDGGRYDRGRCNADGLCEGIWKIGDLESRDDRYLSGRSDGPTLTLLVDGDDLKPITATIASKQTRTVTAGGQTYNIAVTDLDDSDSKDVSIAVGMGRGEPDPELVQSLRVQKHGHIAVLRWEPPADGKVSRWPVSQYQVERNGRLVEFGEDGPLRKTLYVDLSSGASSSTYRVRAVSDQGVPGPWTSVDGSVQAASVVGAPGAPGAFTATLDQFDGRVYLTWTPAPANNLPISHYEIEGADQRNGPWSSVAANPGADETSAEFYPTVGSSRYFRIRAVNVDGTPGPWATAEAAAPPGMPENLRFTSLAKSSVTLAWDPPSGDGGPRITGYQYHVMGPCGDGSEDPLCEVKPATRVSGTRASISGLNRNGIYAFQVRALSGAGASEWSHSIQTMLRPEISQSGRVVLSPSSLTVREGGEATYRVRLSRNPTMPVWVVMHWDGSGNENLGAELPFQQFKILLPSGYDTADMPEWCGGVRLDWDEAYAWNAGAPITVSAAEDTADDEEMAGRPKNASLTILHSVNTVPHDCLGMAEEDWSPDPVYDGVDGPALVVTERDND